MKRSAAVILVSFVLFLGRPSAAAPLPLVSDTIASPATWQLRAANGQSPQQDFTAWMLSNGHDILTGGPLAYGPPLAAIVDVTGPDGAEIASLLDRSEGLMPLTRIAGFTSHGRPPLPLGVVVPGWHRDAIDLRPQHLWILPADPGRTGGARTGTYGAGLPEPATFSLLFLGLGYRLFRRSPQR